MIMTQVAYKIGEIYLCSVPTEFTEKLKEIEILDISQDEKAIKTNKDGWVNAETFHKTVKGKLGYAVYRKLPWPFNKRKVIRTN